MVDKITRELRRKNMQAIKSKSKLEEVVSKELWKKNIRFRRNVRDLPGRPDIAIKKYKIVIFIDSCFWHYCPIHGRIPDTNSEFWKKKLEGNRIHDDKINEYYKNINWKVVRIWEHDIHDNLEEVIKKIITQIRS